MFLLLQVETARGHYENLSLSSACEAVLEISNAGNSYMDEHAPWSRFKQGGAASEAAAKVYPIRFCFFSKIFFHDTHKISFILSRDYFMLTIKK